LQVSVDHEMQSRAHKNLVELQKATKQWEALEKEYEQAKSKTREETECRNELERRVGEIFGKLPNTAQENELPATEKIDQIAQAIARYQKEIGDLREQLTPTTPPAVKEQRRQATTTQIQEMEKQVSTTADLLDKAAQLWTRLEEDPQVQRWDKEEERINAAIQELKQRKNTIPIPERVKGTQELKKMQAELITAQTQKQERQAQIEPLQERVAEVLAQAEADRTQMAQTQAECTGLLSDEVVIQVVETIKEKTAQALTKATELKEKFQMITEEIEEAQKD
jgi:chromosome segregation ATPase